MNKFNFKTNNYDIGYDIFNYNSDICDINKVCDKLLIRELYRINLYKKLSDYLRFLVIEHTKDENYNMSLLTDYLTMFIFNSDKDKFDPIFNKISPFNENMLSVHPQICLYTVSEVSN